MSAKNGDEKATPALEFRKVREQGVLQTLPSGRTVRMRNVKPAHLLRLGKIPDVLTPLVIKALYGQAAVEDFAAFLRPTERVEEALAVAESLKVVCTAALIEPRIVDHPQADDEIHIDDLSDADQGWIFNLAFLEADALSSFRLKPTANVAVVDDGSGHPQPAQPPGGDN